MSRKHTPTPEQRDAVLEAVGLGGSQLVISKMLGISIPTLEKAYRHELDIGGEIACQRVAKSLYERAVDPKAGMPGVTAGIFFLKARGKSNWRDDYKTVEHVGPDGNPLQLGGVQIYSTISLPDNGRDPHLNVVNAQMIDGEVVPLTKPTKMIAARAIDAPRMGALETPVVPHERELA